MGFEIQESVVRTKKWIFYESFQTKGVKVLIHFKFWLNIICAVYLYFSNINSAACKKKIIKGISSKFKAKTFSSYDRLCSLQSSSYAIVPFVEIGLLFEELSV